MMPESELWDDLEAALARTLASVEPLGVLQNEADRMIHRARGSMHVAFGRISNYLDAAAASPELAGEAVARCRSVLRWVRSCNDPLVDAMRGRSLAELQRFAAGLGIRHEGLDQAELFGAIEKYFRAHARPLPPQGVPS